MPDVTIDVKPFWLQEASVVEKHGLAFIPTEESDASKLEQSIPKLKTHVGDMFELHYGVKDGLFVFQLYMTARKKIFDQALLDLESVGHGPAASKITATANEELSKIPWPTYLERRIEDMFCAHFKNPEGEGRKVYLGEHGHKINFYQEVDSWSFVTPCSENREAVLQYLDSDLNLATELAKRIGS